MESNLTLSDLAVLGGPVSVVGVFGDDVADVRLDVALDDGDEEVLLVVDDVVVVVEAIKLKIKYC